jgi:hypothetical protein
MEHMLIMLYIHVAVGSVVDLNYGRLYMALPTKKR